MDRVLSTRIAEPAAGSNATTWSEMIKEVEATKKNLPWKDGDFLPAKRVPLPERKAMERKLNPITMRLRDDKQELEYSRKKMDRTVHSVLDRYNKIKDSEYNIVSHIGPSRNYEKVIEDVNSLRTKPARNWNLFSHLEHSKQTTCPILYNAEYMDKHRPPKSANMLPPPGQARDFNIISNQFSQDNDSMLKADYNKMKKDMVKKYWETHDYNPITTEYYSDDKEEKVRAEERTMRATHGANIDDKLPDRYKYSEGKAYNILTLDVKNDDMIKRALRTEVKKENRLSKFKGYQEEQVNRGVAEYQKAREASMARVGYTKWDQEIKRGYDFVSTGPAIAATHKPRPQPPKSVWQKVQDQNFSTNYASNTSNDFAIDHGALPRETYRTQPGQISPTTHGEGGSRSGRNNAAGPITTASPRTNAMLNAQVSSARDSARLGPDSARSSGQRSTRSVHPKVPALDLTHTAAPAVPSVRTGGLSVY